RRCSVVAPAFSRSCRWSSSRRSRKKRSCAAVLDSDFGIWVISASVRAFALLAIIPRCESDLGASSRREASHRKPLILAHRKQGLQTDEIPPAPTQRTAPHGTTQVIVNSSFFPPRGFSGRA